MNYRNLGIFLMKNVCFKLSGPVCENNKKYETIYPEPNTFDKTRQENSVIFGYSKEGKELYK